MLEFLNKYIIGQLGDQSGTLWLGSIFYSRKFELLNSFSFEIFRESPKSIWEFLFSNIYNFVYLTFSFFIGPIFSYNLITVIVLILNSYFLFKLLRYLHVDKYVSLFYSILFSFIPYFYLHFEHHTLLFFFPSIYAIYLSFRTKNVTSKYDFLKLGIAIAFQMFFSIYLAYFLLIYLFIFYSLEFVGEKSFTRVIFYIKSLIIFILIYGVFSFNFLLNFFRPENSLIKYNYPESFKVTEISNFEFDRAKPLDDFIFFSSRPWYFILPPSNHLFFGSFTKEFINYFAEEKNLFLFKNHFPYEHNASYIGIFILITSFLCLFIKNSEHKKILNKLFLLSLIVFLLTMPPIIFFAGYEIYTPSYLLYLAFPMFRTLSRFVVFIHLSLFIISAFYISEKIKSFKPQTKVFLLFFFSILVMFDYSLNYKAILVNSLVETGSFVTSYNKERNLISAYPSSFRTELLLNMQNTNSPQINPSGFNVNELEFDSSKFTKELTECITLKYFYDFKGRLVVIKNPVDIKNTDLDKFPTVFESTTEKILIKDISRLNEICIF